MILSRNKPGKKHKEKEEEGGKKPKRIFKSKMILTELGITILTLAMLLASSQGLPMNETNRIVAVVTESPEQSLASSGDGEVNETVTTSCPNYIPGIRNKTGCSTGTMIGSVDHWTAFGLNKGRNTDWETCRLPRVPQTK